MAGSLRIALSCYAFLASVPDPSWTIADTVDFNADEKPVILRRSTATGENVAWFMNGVACTGYSYLNSVKDQKHLTGSSRP
jgi:hypothetical protein